MADQLQLRGGTTAEHATFTGALREVTVDTTKKTVIVHDNATAGGTPLAKENLSNVPANCVTSTMILDGTILNADVNASAAIAGTKISPDFGSQNTTTTGTSTAASFIPSSSTAPANGMYLSAANTLAFNTNTAASPRLVISSGGLVGIGTTTPAFGAIDHGLHISGSGAQEGIRLETTNGSTGILEIYAESGGNTLDTRGSGYIRFNNATTEWGRWDSSGRFLVGTSTTRSNLFNSTVAVPLQVEGIGTSSAGISVISNPGTVSGNSAVVVLGKSRSSSVGGTTIVASGDELGVLTYQGSDGSEFVEAARISAEVDGTPGANDMPGRLVFSTTADGASSPTERMRITNAGYWKATSDGNYDSSTGTYHEIRSNINGADTLRVGNSSTSSGSNAVILNLYSAAGPTSTSRFITGFTGGSAGTARFIVYHTGNVENTNNSYGAISDIKLKENIVDANSQWDNIKDLRVVNYNLKEGLTHRQIGLIAQEVELVSPGLVSESPDRDEEGNDLGTVTKSVNYSVLYMKAVKALQEAMERIETLEAKVAALEAH